MPLSWNEIKSRAVSFTKEWKDEVSEDAEAKSFWDEFFLYIILVIMNCQSLYLKVILLLGILIIKRSGEVWQLPSAIKTD